MQRKCFSCQNIFESENIFCPLCNGISIPYGNLVERSDRGIIGSYPEKTKELEFYNDWDPPAPVTIYCKITNTPYSIVRRGQAMGMYSAKLIQIENDIDGHRYNCELCNNSYEDNAILKCSIKRMIVKGESICKKFNPKPASLNRKNKNQK
jgi:hypothetical protein